jgi:hypothetical protein
MAKQVIEPLKTFIIVLLLASSLFLAGKTGVFNELISSVPVLENAGDWIRSLGRQNSSSIEGSIFLHEAARPVGIVLTDRDGLHVGAMYDRAAINDLYNRVSKTLGEALGSASVPGEVDRRQWEGALGSEGVYFEFSDEIPLTVAARWLGLEMINVNSHSAKRICIAKSGDRTDMYYISGDKRIFRCRTAAVLSGLAPLMNSLMQKEVNFAFELGGDFEGLDPNSLIPKNTPEAYVLKSENLLDNEAARDSVFSAFRINPGSKNTYKINEGKANEGVVYVENNATLEIYKNGLIVYDRETDGRNDIMLPFAQRPADIGDIIEAAWEMIGSLREHDSRGDEVIYFTGVSEAASVYKVTFDYFVNGKEIINDGHGATVTMKDGRIIKVSAYLKSYRLAGEKTAMLPARLAAAIAREGTDGSQLCIAYEDNGADTLVPFWYPKRA